MSNKYTFYGWMKNQGSIEPSAKVDKKILAYSAHYFAQNKNSSLEKNFFFNWKLSGFMTLATLAVVIVLMNRQPSLQKNQMTMIDNESPEMILNYKDIELMADASDLSEAEWAVINGSKK